MNNPKEKIFVLPNSADDVFFQSVANRPPLERLKEGRWFGYFGSLHPWQGIETLLNSWKLIEKGFPEVNLLLIHGGQKRNLPAIKKLVKKLSLKDRVLRHSPISPDLLARTLASLEFTCAPLTNGRRNSKQGCCPIKIIESMAAGTPVIASDLKVVREIIRNPSEGILFPPDQIRALAWEMASLLQDNNRRAALSKVSRETAKRRFTREIQGYKIKTQIENFVLTAGM